MNREVWEAGYHQNENYKEITFRNQVAFSDKYPLKGERDLFCYPDQLVSAVQGPSFSLQKVYYNVVEGRNYTQEHVFLSGIFDDLEEELELTLDVWSGEEEKEISFYHTFPSHPEEKSEQLLQFVALTYENMVGFVQHVGVNRLHLVTHEYTYNLPEWVTKRLSKE